MKPEELLEKVSDRKSFMEFAWALIHDREEAERIEREDPQLWQWGGANNWQNSSISAFLSAAVAHFENPSKMTGDERPTWRDVAEFLYMGKIYE
jgi:hypothetical protein